MTGKKKEYDGCKHRVMLFGGILVAVEPSTNNTKLSVQYLNIFYI